MGWTEERVELLKKLWMEGLSASQIAAALGDGVTRNAVIGKVHRLKLSGRAKPASAAPRVRSAPRPARRPGLSSPSSRSSLGGYSRPRSIGAAPMLGATALKVSEEFEMEALDLPQVQELDIPVEQRLTLLQLNERTCKWPIGDPLSADFYFCGQPHDEGRPYCEFHSRRAYHQIEKKKR
ncbi:MAG TPA: GcrA cell cycle regulator [Alphaproteobacteria bacterium]|nr:GcrA cell cycle regulator [Alphaproteobacteria bacterium]